MGFDDGGREFRELPPLEFGYTDFNPQDRKRRDFYSVQGADLAATSLANSSMELADLFGNGSPDVLEMNDMSQAPAGVALSSVGVQYINAMGARICL